MMPNYRAKGAVHAEKVELELSRAETAMLRKLATERQVSTLKEVVDLIIGEKLRARFAV